MNEAQHERVNLKHYDVFMCMVVFLLLNCVVLNYEPCG